MQGVIARVAVAMVLASAGAVPAFGWDTKSNHFLLVQGAAVRLEDFDRFLRHVYELDDGAATQLEVRLGLGPPEVDADVGPGGPPNELGATSVQDAGRRRGLPLDACRVGVGR